MPKFANVEGFTFGELADAIKDEERRVNGLGSHFYFPDVFVVSQEFKDIAETTDTWHMSDLLKELVAILADMICTRASGQRKCTPFTTLKFHIRPDSQSTKHSHNQPTSPLPTYHNLFSTPACPPFPVATFFLNFCSPGVRKYKLGPCPSPTK